MTYNLDNDVRGKKEWLPPKNQQVVLSRGDERVDQTENEVCNHQPLASAYLFGINIPSRSSTDLAVSWQTGRHAFALAIGFPVSPCPEVSKQIASRNLVRLPVQKMKESPKRGPAQMRLTCSFEK
jgi:hypothetical protein